MTLRLLLDTHIFLWLAAGDPRLLRRWSEAIEDERNEVFVSIASLWEIVIKHALGKLPLPAPIENIIERTIAETNIRFLPIEIEHLSVLGRLPQHHRDPFDRLIISQAIAENLTLVTSDAAFASYDVQKLG